MLRSSATSLTVYVRGLLIAFTASVSRVLSISTTNESTKSWNIHATFSIATGGLPAERRVEWLRQNWRVELGGEREPVVGGPERGLDPVERRRRADLDRAVRGHPDAELDRRLDTGA